MLLETAKNSEISTSHRKNKLHTILNQLNNKITQISDLKIMISQAIYSQEIMEQSRTTIQNKNNKKQQILYQSVNNLINYFRNGVKDGILQQIQIVSSRNQQSVINIINYYQHQIKKCKHYYEAEIWDLREEIKRQYKVIALMKQEVEDLMVLMRYKDSEGENNGQEHQEFSRQSNQISSFMPGEENNQRNQQNARNNSNLLKINALSHRQYAADLSIIQEETERTLQSSQRSQRTNNQENQQLNKQKQHYRLQNKKQTNNIQQDQQNKQNKESQRQIQIQRPLILIQQRQKNQIANDQHFTQDLTPKNTERIQKQKQRNQQYNQILNYSHNKSIFGGQGYQINQDSNRIYYHSQSPMLSNSVNVKQELNNTNSKRNYKMHTAPSDNRKIDHLQSIFFLDDQSEQFLNKSSKFKRIQDKFQFQSHVDNYVGNKYLQHSQVSQNGDDQYPIYDQLHHKKNQVTKKNFNQIFNNIERKMDHTKDEPRIFNKKVNKNCKNMTQEEKSQYIFKKFNKAIPICEFQSSSSVPVPSGNKNYIDLSPKLDTQKSEKSTENKPKTKQFLEQFRKTFNKCLKSMQVSKKNSTKMVNNSRDTIKQSGKLNSSFQSQVDSQNNPVLSGVMTFGKSHSNSNYSSISQIQSELHHAKNRQNVLKQKQRNIDTQSQNSKQSTTIKSVNHMLKQLQNNNKFMIGNKKIQVKYEGEKKNGVRTGNGILYYSNGLCYQGQFKDGVRHGYGILKFNHIQIYNGDWVNDQIEGKGRIRYCSILNNKKTINPTQTPLGKWISYSGEFKNSKFQGSGTLYLHGAQKFVGYFQNGLPCGQGSMYKKDGQVEHNY